MSTPLRYGLIGCGVFGRFCLEAYRQMPDVTCVAVADTNVGLARTTAEALGIDFCESPAALIARPDIDLVHLATPPFTHAELGNAALLADKHVLCEKPLAINIADAMGMIALAETRHRILAVNLIMHYNPLCQAVKSLIDCQVLGEPLYASFVNAAQDETLTPEHWFWDREKSGGIFIEHGVHFFDLFEWWFGQGRVVSALQLTRPGTEIVDQVQCAVRYGPSTLATFYHGFHQMKRRDRQHWRIIFETGTLTMTEWVPTSLELDMAVSEEGLRKIQALLPEAETRISEHYPESSRHPVCRHQPRIAEVHAHLSLSGHLPKMELYTQMVRDLMADQIAAIRDPSHVRRVSEQNGLTSLTTAIAAQMAAD